MTRSRWLAAAFAGLVAVTTLAPAGRSQAPDAPAKKGKAEILQEQITALDRRLEAQQKAADDQAKATESLKAELAAAKAAAAKMTPAPAGDAKAGPAADPKALDALKAELDAVKKTAAKADESVGTLRAAVADSAKTVGDMKAALTAATGNTDKTAAAGKQLDAVVKDVADAKATLDTSKKAFDESLKGVEEIKKTADAGKTDAADAKGKGDTAWMLTSTAFVMFMVPGLALFYGGMVRRKNILGTMMQSMACLSVVGVFWVAFGYGLAFGPSAVSVADLAGAGGVEIAGLKFDGGLIGWDWDLFFLRNVEASATLPGTNVSVYTHMLFQGMFAIITPALISGAVAERIKFWPFCVFTILWVSFVYCPLAHMVWAFDWFGPAVDAAKGNGANAIGLLGKLGALDFAGGTVVHIAAGFAGLAACVVLGRRAGYPKTVIHPNSMVITLLGAGLLWFGWFGFNGGSATASSSLAASAFAATQAAAAAAGLGWILVEWLVKGKPTALGLASGIVAGLVAVTPASGYVYVWGGAAIGLVAAVVCYFAVAAKNLLGYDDSLDAFGVHGVGGFVGAVLTGVFCYAAINPGVSTDGYLAVQSIPARVAELEKKATKLEADAATAEKDAAAPAKPDAKPEDAAKLKDAAAKAKDDAAKARDEATKLKTTKDEYAGTTDKARGPLTQLKIQTAASVLSAAFALVASLLLAVLTQVLTLGHFRTDKKSETDGLDRTEHGEVGFDFGYAGESVNLALAETEPKSASAPKPVAGRFDLAVEGVPGDDVARLWTGLCLPGDKPASPDFLAVYPHVTTFTGNTFRCRGADAPATAARLESLFTKLLPGRKVKVVRV